MKGKKIVTVLVASTLSVLAAAGFLTYKSAYAQSDTATPTTPAQTEPSAPPDRGEMRGGMRGGSSDEDLATALGIDVTKLEEAKTAATAKALEQAVSDGVITQEQADQFSTEGPRGGFPGRKDWMNDSSIDFNALLAEALGISTDELQTAQQQAITISIDNAVTDGSLTEEQADQMKSRNALYADKTFQSSMQTAYESAVQQAVKEGVITQAQADSILKDGNVFSVRGEFGGHGRHGGDHTPAMQDTGSNQ